MEPTHEELAHQVQSLEAQVESLRRGDNNWFVGMVQGLLMALITCFAIVPIVQWIESLVLPFHWIVVACNLYTPFGMAVILGDRKKTNKSMWRLWTYIVVEAALLLLYIIMWPNALLHPGNF